jgi:hemerythrin-like domain-containing protein
MSTPDTPIEVLRQEYTLILQVIAALECKIASWESGAPPDRAYVEKAVEFLRGFADRCQHGKEEDILFVTMVDELDFPRKAGSVAVLTAEHVRGRDFIRQIAEAAAGVGQDPAALRQVIENARGYIQLLRAHIEREDTVVFPMVEQFLDAADHARLAAKFEQFGREDLGGGKHETLARLLRNLTAES